MNLWQQLQQTACAAGGMLFVTAGFFLTSALLYIFLPREQARLRTAVVLFVLSLAGLLIAAAIQFFSGGPGKVGPGNLAHLTYVSTQCVSLFLSAVAMINVSGILIFAVLLRRARFEPPKIVQELLIAFAYLAVGILLLSHSGVNLSGIVATSAVITAVIGFSLQETLGNIMGGMALQMEKTVKIGDWIRVDDIEGRVCEIRWRQTSIETRNWDTVVIPNSLLMKGKVTILGRRDAKPLQRRQWIYFGVEFAYMPSLVFRNVEVALQSESIPNVASDPKPRCLLVDIKASDALYAVQYWLTDFSQLESSDSTIRTRIFTALGRAGIPFSAPTQQILLTEQNESSRERRQSEELDRRIAMLENIDLFKSLTSEERRKLAEGLEGMAFVEGETIIRQDAEAHCLYILVEGEAEVLVSAHGISRRVAVVRAINFFGEMGLLTGEPRTASVVALTESHCYRLGREAFEGILLKRPEIAEQMAFTLARHLEGLEVVREQFSQEAQQARTAGAQLDLLNRIRVFFRLSASRGGPKN